ncbi:hypothetical protein P3W85_43535 [Cupriavidus basilensis]|uniref:Uncharacterized protein n=1 Tax=Cupriavidus basilensis TaxID=68895 RepID=A0ABT6B4F6_9BURK|nr:hypothetical protein [Cupriavidus basilensis]MDF3839764.1 hypothetical protein [Cupriavidus basilensis]
MKMLVLGDLLQLPCHTVALRIDRILAHAMQTKKHLAASKDCQCELASACRTPALCWPCTINGHGCTQVAQEKGMHSPSIDARWLAFSLSVPAPMPGKGRHLPGSGGFLDTGTPAGVDAEQW